MSISRATWQNPSRLNERMAVKTLAKHLTADLYGCKTEAISDKDAVCALVADKISVAEYTVLNISAENISPAHTVVTTIFSHGHMAFHIYPEMRHVAVDIFLCRENAEPETLFKEIRNFFKPEKTRITVLKRGDFKQGGDMKPQTKTRVAPLRKIHNTGAKVIRSLARRK